MRTLWFFCVLGFGVFVILVNWLSKTPVGAAIVHSVLRAIVKLGFVALAFSYLAPILASFGLW